MEDAANAPAALTREDFRKQVLHDFRMACESRQASLLGRKEVLTGKAKFGIFGDGKEVAQIAMAKVFQNGDWRSGYYRDQTFMFARGMSTVQQFFAQLYADPNTDREPASGGRSMNGHFATRLLDEQGNWLPQTDRPNVSADISPTAGQMPRLLGLALASKLYRENADLHAYTDFSLKGNEIAFGTIGNASTSEGIFWETMNAACVMQVPLLMSVWDDGYGISVPAKYQTAKENISRLLSGFQTDKFGQGMEIFTVKGWDYAELCKVYKQAADVCRQKHTPVLVHVTEVTQPQGHSTSGSHERYKSKERLEWEQEYDCIAKMREWLIANDLASAEEADAIEQEATQSVRDAQKAAWNAFLGTIKSEVAGFCDIINNMAAQGVATAEFAEISAGLQSKSDPLRKDIGNALHKALRLTASLDAAQKQPLLDFYRQFTELNHNRYSSHLHSQSAGSALNVPEVPPQYSDEVV
ncbi:MAG: thiamine pyrophosphate-dependent dehydrogenase E1 component subunit alpha, partial [Sphingomonadales bacterium]